jgi:benzoyl-CoA reductase/2-hydroxyglutaryl-CoA dehydratase subunit BcrC/BadD/HgdB
MSRAHPAESWNVLRQAYQNPLETALRKHREGVPIAGYTSNTVPWELLRAAGFFPVLIQAWHAATPGADAYMEPVFAQRIRSIFDELLNGAWSFCKALIISRASEHEHKLYLYLKEVVRQGASDKIPLPYSYNLLHTRSPRSRSFGQNETERLVVHLTEITGRRVGSQEFVSAVRESNAARAALRRLLRLRRGKTPRLSGAEALVAIGAWYFMDRTEYTRAALEFASVVSRRPPIAGPRILIKGSPLDHSGLHVAVESHGAIVTAEDDWWGSRSAGSDIRVGRDPLAAIFRKYYSDAPSPRVFPQPVADRWFQTTVLRDIEGVVFYLPPDDDVLGWDYPRQKRFLDEHGIPSLLIREDAHSLSAQTDERIGEFVAGRRR